MSRALFPTYLPLYLLTKSSPALLERLETAILTALHPLRGNARFCDHHVYLEVRVDFAATLWLTTPHGPQSLLLVSVFFSVLLPERRAVHHRDHIPAVTHLLRVCSCSA